MRTNPVLARLGKYPLAEIQMRARERRDAGLPLIDFSIGDPREPTPEFIPKALAAALPEVSQYPTTRGLPEVREAVAAYLGRRFDVAVDPQSQVIPTTGAKEGIFHAPFAFIDPQAEELVAYGSPGYPVYERGALFAGAVPHPIVLDGDFVLRAGDIPAGVWEQAAMLWICSPHNPTGAVTSRAELEELVVAARQSNTLLLSDECYGDLYEDEPPPSVLEVAGPDYAGVLAFFSCSKRSGMTGYRAGAIVGDAGAIVQLGHLRSSAGVAPAEFVQAAAAAAWGDDEHAAERRRVFSKKRQILTDGFTAIGFDVVASRAAIYLWVRVPDDVAVTRRLLDDGVVVAPGSFFGPGGEGYIRLALVPTVEECAEAVPVLEKCLA
jgi:succinyldiaminopimelate transaminase